MSGDRPSWRRFVVRRLGPRQGYELCLLNQGAVHRWRLEGAPPLRPSAPRVAKRLADGTSELLWFEGLLEREPCIVWDAGRYRVEGDLESELDRGKVRIELEGRKLNGAWALGRRKGTWRGRGRTPLMSAEWDVTAVPRATDLPLPRPAPSVLSGSTISDPDRVVRDEKTREAARQSGAKKRAVPLEPSSASRLDDSAPFRSAEWLFELRRAGLRVTAANHNRRGHVIASEDLSALFPELTRSLRALGPSPLVMSGTVVAEDLRARLALTDDEDAAHAALESPATLWVDDLLAVGGYDTRSLPLLKRKSLLESIVPAVGFVSFVDHIIERGDLLHREVALGKAGPAGITARRASALYAPGDSDGNGDGDELNIVIGDDERDKDAPEPTLRSSNVRMSNREKIFWPAESITKGDLLDYYQVIAPTILTHLVDRPLVLTRFPDGIDGRSFFQHHAPGAKSSWLRTVRLETSRRWRDYFVCERSEDLIYLANLGTIELHGWPSRASNIDRPDWTTIDIDRSKATVADVIATAQAVHALCDELGLPTRVKTSGGDGLHVIIPLAGKRSYDEARMLAELLARTIAAENPTLATLEGSIARRGGKVYLDTMVNARGRMLATPYGVRARPGAPVSTPLEWTEVGPQLDLAAFNLRSVPSRVAEKGDIWSGILDVEADIADALARLDQRLKDR